MHNMKLNMPVAAIVPLPEGGGVVEDGANDVESGAVAGTGVSRTGGVELGTPVDAGGAKMADKLRR